jgi:hypothetical protein
MKTIRNLSANLSMVVCLLMIMACVHPGAARAEESAPVSHGKEQRIMLAILLDTSNSMDGLIDQAKSQLWRIVNELAAAKCDDGARPKIEIAIYEYGNSGLPSSEGYIRLVMPLSNNLDLISEKLFSLRTNGGDEFCGQVIKTALTQLTWSSGQDDLKMIFIAGNEPFTQGLVPYAQACGLAKEKGVIVNTIFCGSFDEGVQTGWKHGADLTGGSYMSIEQNRKTVYIPTPYDDKIAVLNDQLNETYIYYGKSGARNKELQSAQDNNAASYSQSNKVERAVSKSSHVYKNSSWDLIDAAEENDKVIASLKDEDLPKELQGLTLEQRKMLVKKKADERKKIQQEIINLNKQRTAYLSNHTPATEDNSSLDGAMMRSIREKGKSKNLQWQ